MVEYNQTGGSLNLFSNKRSSGESELLEHLLTIGFMFLIPIFVGITIYNMPTTPGLSKKKMVAFIASLTIGIILYYTFAIIFLVKRNNSDNTAIVTYQALNWTLCVLLCIGIITITVYSFYLETASHKLSNAPTAPSNASTIATTASTNATTIPTNAT
jgi:predicted Na+-dependent transporter